VTDRRLGVSGDKERLAEKPSAVRRRLSGSCALIVGAAVVAAVAMLPAPSGAATPKLSCAIAKALERVPAKPVWFPVPQPMDTTLTVNGDARPTFANGLNWMVETRYFWLGRMPRGTTFRDPGSKVVLSGVRFTNLGRSIDIVRLRDGRYFAKWPTSGSGKDTTVAVAKNMSSTEFGEFVASLRKVQWPTGCGTA
jgi:hypothetical protein